MQHIILYILDQTSYTVIPYMYHMQLILLDFGVYCIWGDCTYMFCVVVYLVYLSTP